MSLMPVFKLGLWNAWIFILTYFLMLVVFSAYDRQKGSSRPMTPPLNEREKKIDRIALLIFLVSVAYSFFLPLKLGTAWLYVGLFAFFLV
jgi:hypothetical protein